MREIIERETSNGLWVRIDTSDRLFTIEEIVDLQVARIESESIDPKQAVEALKEFYWALHRKYKNDKRFCHPAHKKACELLAERLNVS